MSKRNSIYDQMIEIYDSGQVPWDSGTVPPELVELVEKLPPGRALDLGCGYGRASIHMAKLGWQVDAVEFVPSAIDEARVRATDAGVASQITFHLSSVADLSFLQGSFDFALDVGCLHNLPETELVAYRSNLLRLVRHGGLYLLFARLYQPQDAVESEFHGIPEESIRTLFNEGFVLERVEHGITQVEDQPPWASAWFWLRRLGP